MLHIFVVPLELDLIIVELVWYHVKPTARLLQYNVKSYLYAEVRNKVKEGHDDQRISDELIGH